MGNVCTHAGSLRKHMSDGRDVLIAINVDNGRSVAHCLSAARTGC